MRSSGLALTLQRMGAYRLVLAAVALLTLITAALLATLATFAGQALSQAVHRRLATAPGASIAISTAVDASQAAASTQAIRAAMRSAFGPAGYALYRAQWSDSLGFPARYAAASVPLTQAASWGGISAHAVLVSGSWPAPPQPGQPVAAALPASAAALLHLAVGDVLVLHDQASGHPVRVKLAGLFRPRALTGPAAAYWGLDIIGANGAGGSSGSSGGFTTYGPLIVNPAAFGSAVAVSQASWVAEPDTADIADSQLARTAAKVSTELQFLGSNGSLNGMQVTSGLPALLSGVGSNLLVARSLLTIGAVLLVLLAAVALAGAARLLTTDREGESALLTARGSSRWQLAGFGVAEAALLAAVAAAAGGLAGGRLAGVLARTGPLRAAGLRLPSVTPAVGGAIALTAVFAVIITLGPTLAAPGAVRMRRGRPAAIAGFVRSGADLALVVLAVLAVWQLRRYLIVAPSANGTAGIDPVLVLAPALAIVGGTVILLRLLPALTRAGDRLAARGSRLILSLASWEVSRHPIRQASVALLVVMAVATGALTLSAHQSWVRSAQDQAAFAAGADVRVDTPAAVTLGQAGRIAGTPAVRDAVPAAPLTPVGASEVLAIDAPQAAGAVLLRPGQSTLAAPALFGAISPAGPAPGIALPGHPAGVSLTASLGPAALRLAPAVVTVTVQDSRGDAYQLAAGTLPADGRAHVLTAGFGPGGRPSGAAYPIRLTGVSVSYTMLPAPALRQAVLTVRGIAAPGAATPSSPAGHALLAALGGWTPAASSGELASLRSVGDGLAAPSSAPGVTSWQAVAGGARALSFSPGYGLATPPPHLFGPPGPPLPIFGQLTLVPGQAGRPVPAIATSAFLTAKSADVGSVVQVPVGGVTLPVKIVAAVTHFPTVNGSDGGVIVDLATVQAALAGDSAAPLPVTEWWLATAGSGDPPGLAGRLPAGSAVTSSGRLAAGLLGDPLSAVPQQGLLAIAAATALLAMAGFCVSIAANISRRRQQNALLSALGVTRGSQARQLCLEELMLSLPSALVGLALGAAISGLLVPAITLTTNATRPVPAAVAEFDWSLALPLALAVAVLPVLVAAVTVARRPDPAASLRTAESL
ncbi:MAG TPA: FtsX-like permease family protein [Streptosporangiaceae bacterium]|jgi:hypothetical protein